MKKNDGLDGFRKQLVNLIARYVATVNAEELMSSRLIAVRSKGNKIDLLIHFKAVRMLGLTHLRRIRCCGSSEHLITMIEKAFLHLSRK